MRTRLPSKLRQTTREYVHLVTRGRFRSRDKDGCRSIASVIAEDPMVHANFTTLCFIELELLPIEVSHCGDTDLWRFLATVTLTLTRWPSYTNITCRLIPWRMMYRTSENELSTSSYLLTDRQTDRQTDRHDRHCIPRRFADGHSVKLWRSWSFSFSPS